MKDTITCTFTNAEADHIWALIKTDEQYAKYTGLRKQYWKRSERIKSKLASKVD